MFRDNAGFTLIEFLVSIVILMVGLLGLLQAVNVAYSHNLQNQVRNEAVVVADEEMARELAKGYDGVDLTNTSVFRNYTVSRKMLNAFKTYSVAKIAGAALPNSKQITVQVRWKYKGAPYTHNASGIISKTNQ